MKKETVRHELKNRARAAGVTTNVYPHLLRHSYITEMLKQDISVAKVVRIVGHANPMVTLNTYCHLVIDDLKEAGQRYPLIKKKEKIIEEKPTREIIYVTVPENQPLDANLPYSDGIVPKSSLRLKPILADKLPN